MTIGFYIHHTAISAGGIFTYSIGILRQIVKANEIEKIIIITSNEIRDRLNEFSNNPKVKIRIVDRNKLSIKIIYSLSYLIYNVTIILQKYFSTNKLLKKLKSLSTLINPYKKIIESGNISLFHVPVQYSPIYKTKIPVIITMHDLQEYHYPEFFKSKERRHRVINNNKAIYDSDHILVSFRHVKDDIKNYFKVSEDKISVCPPPFAESWFLAKEESSWEDLSMKFGIKKNYLLYPAATWKHKNHVTLIRVIKKLRDEGIEINLVCMGNKTNHFKDIQTLIDELKLSDAIYFLGIIPEEDLIGLYKNTSLVVIPTLYEAGSGPLYEAMRFEVPVVCSNVTSLPDTIGNIDFVFDPLDVNAIASKIRQGLIDVEFRRNNIQNSRKRMEEFQKFDYSKNFIEVYHKLIHTL
jgi:glycosyltransferase involved in cell wall biosynthesis